jgi:hypothetical protein
MTDLLFEHAASYVDPVQLAEQAESLASALKKV